MRMDSRSILACVLLAILGFVHAQFGDQRPILFDGVPTSDCHNACTALVAVLGRSVHYDSSSQILEFREQYYSTQQREVIPACIVTPSTSEDVATSISIIRRHACIFAVKSGGHAMFKGASNAPGGITIDLKLLNEISVLEDKNGEAEVTRVGPGNRWKDVYQKLDPMGLTVVGGRASIVGVGGFILGGGISHVSRRHGWALDNVRNFEVVLANASLVNINQTSSPDLYFSLRGGGNNFGIVTRFDLETYPQGKIWGGHNFFLASTSDISSRKSSLKITSSPATSVFSALYSTACDTLVKFACRLGYCITITELFSAFKNVVLAEESDPDAQIIAIFGWVWQLDAYVLITNLVYNKPVEYPKVFEDHKPLIGRSVYSSMKIREMTDVYREVNSMNEEGFRQKWATFTFHPSTELLSIIIDIYIKELEYIKKVKHLQPSLIFQPINKDEIAIFQRNGGNALGIVVDDAPLILSSLAIHYSLATDDDVVHTAAINIVNRSIEEAKRLGVHHRYLYPNYADQSQDVYAGYGDVNRERLRRIQRENDPDGVFSRLQPGYFKV